VVSSRAYPHQMVYAVAYGPCRPFVFEPGRVDVTPES
jgi:hypothetical protein